MQINTDISPQAFAKPRWQEQHANNTNLSQQTPAKPRWPEQRAQQMQASAKPRWQEQPERNDRTHTIKE